LLAHGGWMRLGRPAGRPVLHSTTLPSDHVLSFMAIGLAVITEATRPAIAVCADPCRGLAALMAVSTAIGIVAKAVDSIEIGSHWDIPLVDPGQLRLLLFFAGLRLRAAQRALKLS
jgi:hypothetical protein